MLQILTITTPIYLIIGLGYLAVRQGYLARENMPFLGQFLIKVVLPVLVFRAVASHPLGEILNLSYLLVYGLASMLVYAIGVWYVLRVRRGTRPAVAFYSFGMANSNSAFIGFPIILELLGLKAGIALALCMLVENLVVIPLTLVIADASEGVAWQRAWAASLRQLPRNPIFIGISLGFAGSALGVHLPAAVDKTLLIIGNAAGALALFLIGGVLVGQKIKGQGQDIAMIVTGKLVLHPLAVLLLLWCVPSFDPALQTAAFLFACMPLPSVYPALAQKYHLDGFCAATLVVATVVSFITLNTWLALTPTVMHFIQTGSLL